MNKINSKKNHHNLIPLLANLRVPPIPQILQTQTQRSPSQENTKRNELFIINNY